ncbi:hypothetical protein V6N12_024416 [Hibiscus sabdariffa]|uniref:GAG-pre-integrase domain-containing protein n=1 Tax=Hibiscus sabdariffa TaxID=183260 RepID=A0ABR2G0P0_9ROSI
MSSYVGRGVDDAAVGLGEGGGMDGDDGSVMGVLDEWKLRGDDGGCSSEVRGEMGDEWQHRWRWGMAKMRIVVILVELKTIRMVSWVGSAGVAADSRYKEWQCVGVQETMGHDAGKLDDAGYMNIFGRGNWKLTRNNMIVARGNKQGSLYVTQGKLCKGEANVACGNSCLELWHKRLGHISKKGLQILAQKALIPAVKDQTIEDTKQSGSSVSKSMCGGETAAFERKLKAWATRQLQKGIERVAKADSK